MCQGMSQGVGEWVCRIWSSNFSYRSNNLSSHCATMHDSVESVDGIGSIFDHALGAIGFDQRIGTGHNISRSGFLLALVITGDGILDFCEHC